MKSFLSFFFTSLITIISVNIRAFNLVPDQSADDDKSVGKNNIRMFNFASQAAGAIILDHSPTFAKGFNNLLNNDKDKYGISPCAEKKWVVIGLSEDILITSVVMANYEKYSSMLKEFQVLASTSYPTEQWIDLGTYTAEPRLGEQTFNITQLSSAHTRYVKIKFKTHYQDEALCTLSQIKVHGMTVIASLHEEAGKETYHVRDVLNDLHGEVSGNTLETIENPTSSQDSVNSTINSESQANDVISSQQPTALSSSGSGSGTESESSSLLNATESNSKSGASPQPDETTTSINESERQSNALILAEQQEKTPLGDDSDISNNAMNETAADRSTDSNDNSLPSQTTEANGSPRTILEEGEEENEGEYTTDSVIALCERMSTIPAIDNVFQEVSRFMRSTNSLITQQQKDETAASISEGLRHIIGLGGQLRTLPQAQPNILSAAVEVVKRIFYPFNQQPAASLPLLLDDKPSEQEEKSSPVIAETPSIDAKEEINVEASETLPKLNNTIDPLPVEEMKERNTESPLPIDSDISDRSNSIGSSNEEVISKVPAVESNSSIEASEAIAAVLTSDSKVESIIQLIQNFSSSTASVPPVKLINMTAVNDLDDAVNYIQQEKQESSEVSNTQAVLIDNQIGVNNSNLLVQNISRENLALNSTLEIVDPPVNFSSNATSQQIEPLQAIKVETNKPLTGNLSTSTNDTSPLNGTKQQQTSFNGSSINANSSAINGSVLNEVSNNFQMNCFETLNFTEFKAKMLSKLQAKSGGSNGDAQADSSKDNNVFKAMIQRIKNLETNDFIVEMFTTQVVDCYRAVTREYLKRSDISNLTAQLEKSLMNRSNAFPTSTGPRVMERESANSSAVVGEDCSKEVEEKSLLSLPFTAKNDRLTNALMVANSNKNNATAPSSHRAQRLEPTVDDYWSSFSFNKLLRIAGKYLSNSELNNEFDNETEIRDRLTDIFMKSESLLSFLEKHSMLICICCLLVTVISLCTCVFCLTVTLLLVLSRRRVPMKIAKDKDN